MKTKKSSLKSKKSSLKSKKREARKVWDAHEEILQNLLSAAIGVLNSSNMKDNDTLTYYYIKDRMVEASIFLHATPEWREAKLGTPKAE